MYQVWPTVLERKRPWSLPWSIAGVAGCRGRLTGCRYSNADELILLFFEVHVSAALIFSGDTASSSSFTTLSSSDRAGRSVDLDDHLLLAFRVAILRNDLARRRIRVTEGGDYLLLLLGRHLLFR